MIQNDEQLLQTRQALIEVEDALAALTRQRASIHPDRYALMAEPILDQIARLRKDIERYVGITAASEAAVHVR